VNKDNFLTPNTSRAASISLDIKRSWRESLDWCFDRSALGHCRDELQGLALPLEPLPIDFGLYFDLVTAISSGASSEIINEIVDQFVARYTQPSAGQGQSIHGLDLLTLREPFFNHSEIDCLIRWLDLEPENSMGLSPLSDSELGTAKRDLTLALDALKICCPEFYAEFLAITRQIVMAKPSGQQKLTFGGASSFALWGGVTLNLEAHPDWWLYLPRLVHEYSHNMLFGFARHEPLVLNDPEERYMSPLRGQPRPLDGIFHAAYVSAREALTMRQIITRIDQDVAAQNIKDLKPFFLRILAGSTLSFKDCYGVIQQHGNLSELGRAVMHDTASAMQ
jgi:hypothetical protein